MAFAIGISVEEFKHLTPYKLECCLKGHKLKMKMNDEEMWILGKYFASSLDATVCNAYLWRRKGESAHSYTKKPFLSSMESKSNNNSQEEVAIFEMKQRTKLLEKSGLKASPM